MKGEFNMKGRKLSLEEVLKLPLSSRVWYEEFDYVKDFYSYNSPLHGIVYFCGNYIVDSTLKYKDIRKCFEDGLIYEWVDEEAKNYTVTYKSNSEIINSMAQEICNLRGLDLTDDNIRLIVEEFSKQKRRKQNDTKRIV